MDFEFYLIFVIGFRDITHERGFEAFAAIFVEQKFLGNEIRIFVHFVHVVDRKR